MLAPEKVSDFPLVTIAIPIRNEARLLLGLLEAVRAQTWPLQAMQVIVMDGLSEDESVAIANAAADDFFDFEVISNPGRIAATALNLALERARGTYFLRLDARSRPAPDYIEQCVISLQSGPWAGVAGAQVVVGDSPQSWPIALAISCSLGTGWPAYRRVDTSCESETLFLGAYPTAKLRQIGGWDERFVANEDYELNTRLRKNRGKLMVARTVQITYIARDTLKGLACQYHKYGSWRVRTWLKHPHSIQPRHLAPAVWAAGLVVGVLLLPITYWPLLLFAVPYVLSVTLMAAKLASRYNWRSFIRIWLSFPFMHLCWGFGFWRSLLLLPFRGQAWRQDCDK
jgi:glycosyltransferase involved in cell wall biosynthesis